MDDLNERIAELEAENSKLRGQEMKLLREYVLMTKQVVELGTAAAAGIERIQGLLDTANIRINNLRRKTEDYKW